MLEEKTCGFQASIVIQLDSPGKRLQESKPARRGQTDNSNWEVLVCK